MTTARDVLVAAAAGIGAVVTIVSVLWWLVWPRVEDKLEQVARGVRRVEEQTAGDQPDTLSRHARVAATAASEFVEIRDKLDAIASKQRDVDDWQTEIARRVGMLEESLIALLSDELRSRLHGD